VGIKIVIPEISLNTEVFFFCEAAYSRYDISTFKMLEKRYFYFFGCKICGVDYTLQVWFACSLQRLHGTIIGLKERKVNL
jgi:hypothetical protein